MTKPKKPIVRTLLCLTALCAFAVTSLSGSTLVHWNFDEGSDGASVPAGAGGGEAEFDDTVLDSSGNGNHLRTWANFSAPVYSANVPFGSVPQTGRSNSLALDFSPNQDLYAAGKPINAQQFTEWTIEASFMANVVDNWQVIVGKDGHPLLPGQPQGGDLHGAPPVFLKTLAFNSHLELGLVDGAREFHGIQSTDPLQTGQWYSVAATATANEISLWLKGPGDSNYVLQGSAAISGAFLAPSDFNDPADFEWSWSVGRGMWNGNIADWFDGMVDEVRISDTALDPSEFMAIPEPSTYALLGGLAALALVMVRRRKS